MSHARTKGGPTDGLCRQVPFKEWATDEALRQCVTVETIYWRVKQGKYPNLNIRRVNQRVMFVRTP